MKLVIIGNGIAGTTTARMVAEKDSSIEIDIYTDEPYLYYPRPRLIDLVAGKVDQTVLPQYNQEWYQKRGIRVHTNVPVISVDPREHQVSLKNGAVVAYDRLVLANGASSYVPPFEGSQLDGILTLRSLDDAMQLRERSQSARNTIILGGGLLGLDLAMALKTNCANVTVIEMMPRLLPRQLDEAGARILTTMVTRRGVEVITNDACARVCGDTSVNQVLLKSGHVLPADLVAVSAGVRPNTQLARDAGIACNRGVLVDAHLRTSEPDILAIGDVAEFNQRVWGIIPVALAQARTAASVICGDTSSAYQEIVPSTTLKVTGIDLTSIGEVTPEGNGFYEVTSQDEQAGIYKKIVIRDGLVVGAILLGDRLNVKLVNTLIEKQISVTGYEARLLEPAFSVEDVIH